MVLFLSRFAKSKRSVIFFFLVIGTRWSDHTDSLRVGLHGVTIGLVVWAGDGDKEMVQTNFVRETP
jgi:hypothetical protein